MPEDPKQEKKIRFRLSPELADGDHHAIVNEPSEVLEAVKMWCKWSKDEFDESCTITTILMSDEEFDNLIDL